jgi:RNA-directed DNA polymerase
MRLQDLMRRIRHERIRDQVDALNLVLRGHYAYYGITRNIRALQNLYRHAVHYWHKMLCSRSRKGKVRWSLFERILERFPLLRPKLYLPYRELQAIALL